MSSKEYVPWWILHESKKTAKKIHFWYYISIAAIDLGIIIAYCFGLSPKGAIFTSFAVTFGFTVIGVMSFISVDNPYKTPFVTVIIGMTRFNKLLTKTSLGPDKDFLMKIAKLYRFDLRGVPSEYITKEFAKGLIEIEPENILYTPFEEHKTKEEVKKAVTKEPMIFKYLSPDLKTEELAIIAVKYNPKLLQYVDNQTPAIVCTAIQYSVDGNQIDPSHIKHKDVANASRKGAIKEIFKNALEGALSE